jgi:ApaG protein
MYQATTRAIRVSVKPYFIDEQSEPEDNHFVWAYRVQIENTGPETVQLRSRYWRITDSAGGMQEVEGEGVVGEQPVLRPGESFEYVSGTPLSTPSGVMLGRYTMENTRGEAFEVEIPPFSLDSPYESVSVN